MITLASLAYCAAMLSTIGIASMATESIDAIAIDSQSVEMDIPAQLYAAYVK